MTVHPRLLTVVLTLFSAGVASGAGAPAWTDIKVTDFGAVPDDGRDDGPAVRAAVAACRQPVHPRLVFPRGSYNLDDASTAASSLVEFSDFPEITVEGDRAELIGSGVKAVMLFQRCGQVAVRGFDVDWGPLPFTAGRVVAAQPGSFDLEVIPPHPLRDSIVQAIITYDGERRIPLASALAITQKSFAKHARILGPDRLRIFLSPTPELVRPGKGGQRTPVVGDHVLAWYLVRGGGAFRATGCGTVQFEDNRVYAAPGMGFASNSCDSVSLRNCQVMVKPGSGRWMSTTVDATHCNMIRRSVEYIDCRFEGMGDDAINIHGMYSMVHARPDARTVVLRGWKSIFNTPALMAGLSTDDFAAPAARSMRPGDLLEFGTTDNPLVPAFSARIAAITPVQVRDTPLLQVEFDRDLPDFVGAGSIVANTGEIPRVLIRNCVFRGGRGCGIRLKSRHALVEGCTFEDVFGAGVWITCDCEVDHESIATRDITIRDNLFRRTGSAVLVSAGRKRTYPDVHEDLRIEGNRIEQSRGTPLRIRSVKGAVIRDNLWDGPAAEPVLVELSSDVRVENNRMMSAPPAGN